LLLTPNHLMIGLAACALVVALQPRVLRLPFWRATVTPLASIIGSGFLVAGPILAHAAGRWATAAMAALCGAGWLFGSAIRHNIAVVEPAMAAGPPRWLAVVERLSDLALALAYFVSVAYYLNLFSAFALRAGGLVDPELARLGSTTVIAALGLIGALRSLHGLEQVEVLAVGLKLALIAGLLGALGLAAGQAWHAGEFALPVLQPEPPGTAVAVLLGLVILVQGFETSRYLGRAYDAPMRIRSMRVAQISSTLIYIAFIALLTPWFTGSLPAQGGETEVIDLLRPVGSAIGPLVIVAALASQLSAAVADMNGAGGLLATATEGRLKVRIAYVVVAAVAVLITWSADIFVIISWASKAFVVYYGLQSAIAAWLSWRPLPDGRRSLPRSLAYAAGVLLAGAVLAFGLPAEA